MVLMQFRPSLTVLFIAVHLSLPEPVSSGYCIPPFDLAADGNCYWIKNDHAPQSSHDNTCRNTLSTPAVIKSTAQIAALANLIISKIPSNSAYNVSYWLGMNCTNNVYMDAYGETPTFLPWNPGHVPQCDRCIQLTKGVFTTIMSATCTASVGAICQLLTPYNEPGLTDCPLPVPGLTKMWQNGNSCNYFTKTSLTPASSRYLCQTTIGGDLCLPVLLTDFNDLKQHFTSEYGSFLLVGLRVNHTATMAVNSYNWLDGTPFLAQNSSGLTQWQGNQSTNVNCASLGTTGVLAHSCTCPSTDLHSFCCRVLLVPGNHTYRRYQRATIIGAGLGSATNVSLSVCQQLCDYNTACRATVYTDTGVCYLKQNNSFLSVLQPSASADFYEHIDTPIASLEYKGCFEDQQALRDLPYLYNMSSSATTTNCIQRCTDKGYNFAGLQAGQLCMCGKSYGRYGVKPNTACGMRCLARSNQYCGGTLHNAVYFLNPQTLQGRMSTRNGYRLINHVLRAVVSPDLFVCTRECIVDDTCRSFNYSPSSRQCELSSFSHVEAAVNELISAAGWLYGSDNTRL